jgi:hypothetical protein
MQVLRARILFLGTAGWMLLALSHLNYSPSAAQSQRLLRSLVSKCFVSQVV